MLNEKLRVGVLPEVRSEVGKRDESKEDEVEWDEGVGVRSELEIEVHELRKISSGEDGLL